MSRVSLSGTVNLSCQVTGFPRPFIKWKIPERSTATRENNRLVIRNVSRYDQGQYICQASNNGGIAKEVFTVIVNGIYVHSINLSRLIIKKQAK